MKTIGIIGGIGPETTIIYYRQIIKKFKEFDKSGNYPKIIVNSINLTEMLGYISDKKYDTLVEFLTKEIKKLKLSGADFGIIASNTTHIVFDRLQKNVDLPLISIIEETCKAIKSSEVYRAGLIGTRFIMQGEFYKKVANRLQVELILPDMQEQDYIHERYINELVPGIINEETKKRLIEIINDLQKRKNIKGLILGGTELSLILNQQDFPHLKIFDTIQIHVDSIMEYLLCE